MSFANFVDTQNVSLTNNTDVVTYTQATNIRWQTNPGKLTRRIRTDGVFENLWQPRMPSFEADIMVTEPQLAGLIALTLQSNNQLPIKSWSITMTDNSSNSTTITGSAQLSSFNFVDPGIGSTTYHIRLEFIEESITVT